MAVSTFIETYEIDPSVCDEIVEFFERNRHHAQPGRLGAHLPGRNADGPGALDAGPADGGGSGGEEGGTVGALSSSGAGTQDNRNKFDKAFDEMQAEWDARQAEISFFLRQAEI